MTCSIDLKKLGAIGALLVLAALTACGGSDDDDDTPGPPAASDTVPQSAGASAQAMFDYIDGLAVSNDTEPLTITSGFLPPTSDTAEPFAID